MLPPDPDSRDPARKVTRNWMKYSGMAFQMIGVMLACVFAGIYLDSWLGTNPIFTIVMSLIGVSGGLYAAIKDFI